MCRERRDTFAGPFLYYCPLFIFTVLVLSCVCVVCQIASGNGGDLEKMLYKDDDDDDEGG